MVTFLRKLFKLNLWNLNKKEGAKALIKKQQSQLFRMFL